MPNHPGLPGPHDDGTARDTPGRPGAPQKRNFGWREALLAIAAAVIIVGAAIFIAGLLTAVVSEATGGTIEGPRRTLAFLMVMQAAIAFFSIAAAGMFGRRDDILSAVPPSVGPAAVLRVVGVMAVVLGLFTLATVHLVPELVEQDLGQFRPILKSELAIPAFVALAIGAPVSEELLFRGFLMGVLRRTWLGVSGAALVATFSWTLLHIGYSAAGLIEVFIAGLLFSWALWRTGSILVPIVCHALYNATVLIVLWSFSFGT